MNQIYLQTVNLLLEVLPSVFKATCFAMKGGTAINLFVQDMPRLSHNRPVREVLFPNQQPIAETFNNEFAGMTYEDVTVEKLEGIRSTLMEEPPKALTLAQKGFLLSLVQGRPDWGKLPFGHFQTSFSLAVT